MMLDALLFLAIGGAVALVVIVVRGMRRRKRNPS